MSIFFNSAVNYGVVAAAGGAGAVNVYVVGTRIPTSGNNTDVHVRATVY